MKAYLRLEAARRWQRGATLRVVGMLWLCGLGLMCLERLTGGWNGRLALRAMSFVAIPALALRARTFARAGDPAGVNTWLKTRPPRRRANRLARFVWMQAELSIACLTVCLGAAALRIRLGDGGVGAAFSRLLPLWGALAALATLDAIVASRRASRAGGFAAALAVNVGLWALSECPQLIPDARFGALALTVSRLTPFAAVGFVINEIADYGVFAACAWIGVWGLFDLASDLRARPAQSRRALALVFAAGLALMGLYMGSVQRARLRVDLSQSGVARPDPTTARRLCESAPLRLALVATPGGEDLVLETYLLRLCQGNGDLAFSLEAPKDWGNAAENSVALENDSEAILIPPEEIDYVNGRGQRMFLLSRRLVEAAGALAGEEPGDAELPAGVPVEKTGARADGTILLLLLPGLLSAAAGTRQKRRLPRESKPSVAD